MIEKAKNYRRKSSVIRFFHTILAMSEYYAARGLVIIEPPEFDQPAIMTAYYQARQNK